jgi:hypothetical protein
MILIGCVYYAIQQLPAMAPLPLLRIIQQFFHLDGKCYIYRKNKHY